MIWSFFFQKGLVADATDGPQPWGLLCNPCDVYEDDNDYYGLSFA
jgi:hypothetical protein